MIHKIKKKLKAIDSRYLNGKMKKVYKKLRRIGAEPFYNIEGYLHRKYRDGQILYEGDVALKDIILSQYHNDDYENYRFVNGVVELAAIEDYYGLNNYGFRMYAHMQEDCDFDWIARFKKLIKSYEKNGFDGRHYVQLAKDFAVMDGSHRIMLALYSNMEFIYAKVYQTERDRPFNIDYFWGKGFTLEECKLIKRRRNNLLQQVNYEYVGVIWPPAFHCASQIINDIVEYGDGIHISEIEEKSYEKEDFRGLFKGLYHTDILDEKGMNYKLDIIDKSLEAERRYNIVRFKVKCDNPRMSMNLKNHMPQSETISRIKQWVRHRYEDYINNYEYDIIIHISDNYLQSTFCNLLFSINKDIHILFEELRSYSYAITRIKSVPSQHTKFPYDFHYKSNINIIADVVESEQIIDIICKYCNSIYGLHWINIEKKYENRAMCIKIYLRDFLIFQFEVSSTIEGTRDEFVHDALAQLVRGTDYNYLRIDYELIIRLIAYINNGNKLYHFDYIKENKNSFNKQYIEKYLYGKYLAKAKKIIKELD